MALVQSILIGALVGMAVGVVMMVVGYFVRRRLYRNTAGGHDHITCDVLLILYV